MPRVGRVRQEYCVSVEKTTAFVVVVVVVVVVVFLLQFLIIVQVSSFSNVS